MKIQRHSTEEEVAVYGYSGIAGLAVVGVYGPAGPAWMERCTDLRNERLAGVYMVREAAPNAKLVAYERVSTASQGRSGLGLEAQRKAIGDYAEAKGAAILARFRRMRSLQKFVAVHASVTHDFNSERSLASRPLFKANRAAALAEWRGLCAA